MPANYLYMEHFLSLPPSTRAKVIIYHDVSQKSKYTVKPGAK